MRPLQVTPSITSRDSASLDKYLLEISKIPMITAEEETRLARQIHSGDREAIASLTRSNLRFVVSVAKQYQHRGLPLTDLISEGNMGLMRAAQSFDDTKGFKFISYAVWWIRQFILQAVNTKSRLVRIPENKVQQRHRIQLSIDQLEQELERSPSFEEISNHVQLPVGEVEQITQSSMFHQSIDVAMSTENTEYTLLDILISQDKETDEAIAYTRSLQMEIKRCLATLIPVQQKIVSCFFGIDGAEQMSIGEIALELNLSTERVRQIKQKAILQLRMEKKADLLKPFLG